MLHSIGLLLYRWLYRPVFGVFLFCNTVVISTAAALSAIPDPSGNLAYHCGAFWARLNLAVSMVRIRVRGLEHIVAGQPYIVMSNHQSYYDIWALFSALPLQLRWVMKAELRKVPIFGLACERAGYIFVQRGNSAQARSSLAKAGAKIRAGASVVFFPEGTRGSGEQLRKLKKGGFHVAQAATVPILPVTVNGGHRIFPKGTVDLRPGTMELVIHPPIPVEAEGETERERLITAVRSSVEAGLRAS